MFQWTGLRLSDCEQDVVMASAEAIDDIGKSVVLGNEPVAIHDVASSLLIPNLFRIILHEYVLNEIESIYRHLKSHLFPQKRGFHLSRAAFPVQQEIRRILDMFTPAGGGAGGGAGLGNSIITVQPVKQ